MTDVTILGGGQEARNCSEVLGRAGFSLRHVFELDAEDASPLIVGELQGAFQSALAAVESGRPVLVASPGLVTPDHLRQLLKSRRRTQTLFVWGASRYHPGFRMLRTLRETSGGWCPNYIRHEMASVEAAANPALHRAALAALTLVTDLAQASPLRTGALRAEAPVDSSCGLALKIEFEDLEALISVGLGELANREQTLLAMTSRRVFVDCLNSDSPMRIIDDNGRDADRPWLSSRSASPVELARQQCIAFLEATVERGLADREADTLGRSLSAFDAVSRSLALSGAAVEVSSQPAPPRLWLVPSLKPVNPVVA